MNASEKVLISEEQFYFCDSNAPAPNVPLHPGVSAVIFDEQKRILFMKRTRGDWWCLPGGRMDLDESAQDCCVRETLEETGLQTRIIRLISVNTHPQSVVHYPDGNVHRSFVLCFEAEVIGGALQDSEESQGFRWLTANELDTLKLIPDSRANALDAWSNQPHAIIR